MRLPSLRAYWWRETPNFGDGLTPELIGRLFGITVRWSALIDADLTGSGSVIQWVTPVAERRRSPLTIWGSGFIFDEEPPPPADSVVYSAVRGRRSAAFAGLGGDQVLGDPGLLVGLVCAPWQPSGTVGVVPHLDHYDNPVLRRAVNHAGAQLIDVRDSPFDVIDQIRHCEVVLSSSLHGLVVADSFGIPNRWITVGSPPFGGSWKFIDYYSSYFGSELPPSCSEPIRVDGTVSLTTIAARARKDYDRPGLDGLRDSLLASFPF